MKLSDHFVIEKHSELRIIRKKTVSQTEVLSIVKGYGEIKRNRAHDALKEGPKSSIYLLQSLINGKKTNLCLKHYKFQGGLSILKNAFRPSRTLNSLKAAEIFRRLGIKTAEPVAVVEKRKGLLIKESFLIMEDISHYLGIPEYIEKKCSPPLTKEQILRKRTFILKFARFLSQLHEKGIYQNDFKTTNVYVNEAAGDNAAFCLIDLDHVIFATKVSMRRKVKNLVQINTSVPAPITLADRMRFFHHYTGKTQLTKEDKKVIRKIARMSWSRNPHWHPRFGMDARRIREWQ